MYTLVIKMPFGLIKQKCKTFELASHYFHLLGDNHEKSIEDFEGRMVCSNKSRFAEDKNVKK